MLPRGGGPLRGRGVSPTVQLEGLKGSERVIQGTRRQVSSITAFVVKSPV